MTTCLSLIYKSPVLEKLAGEIQSHWSSVKEFEYILFIFSKISMDLYEYPNLFESNANDADYTDFHG